MRYRLRTLLVVGTLGPPVLAAAWLVTGRAVQLVRDIQKPDFYEVQRLLEWTIGSTMAVGLAMVAILIARRAWGSS